MHRELGILIKSSAGRVAARVAVLVLVSSGAIVSFGSPAAAAAAAPALFIRSELNNYCLDQHYNDQGQPTTTVFAYFGPCHYAGNQQWEFVPMGGNSYRVVNSRSGWCLSAPNGHSSRVFAEYCVNAFKQIWTPVLTSFGTNQLINEGARDGNPNHRYCMKVVLQGPGIPFPEVWMSRCNANNVEQRWYWYAQD